VLARVELSVSPAVIFLADCTMFCLVACLLL